MTFFSRFTVRFSDSLLTISGHLLNTAVKGSFACAKYTGCLGILLQVQHAALVL